MQQPTRSEVRWEWIGQGWELFTAQWQNWVVVALVAFVIIAVIGGPLYFLMIGSSILAGANHGGDEALRSMAKGASFLVQVCFTLILSAVGMVLNGGLYRCALKQLRGGQVSVGDFFSVFDSIVPLVITGVIVSILETIGSYMCIIPGIIVSGLLMFAIPAVVDRNIGPGEALRISFDATKSNWIMFAVFGLVMRILMGLGALACCVGLLATIPLFVLTISIAYRDTLGLPGAYNPDSYSPPPPPNFGGFEPPPPPPASWQ